MSAVAPPTTALEMRDLHVEYRIRGNWKAVLRGVSLQVAAGESYGLVGESGCGKSTAAYAALHYLPRNGRVASGSVHVAGEDLAAMSEADVRRMRAERVSMVYQNPGAALNPTLRIGDQVAEVYTLADTDPKLGRTAGRGDARQGPDRRSGQRHAPLPAPALRRDAAAGGHRHGAGQGPVAADPGRADDGPGRDGRGRGARPRGRAARGVRHERPLHLPQPRRDRAHVRAHRRALRRPARRGRSRRPDLQRPPPPVHRRPAAVHPPRRRAQGPRAARHDPRLPARPRHRPPRLRVRRPLRHGAGRLQAGGAAVPRHGRRAPQPVPLLGAGARVAARDPRRPGPDGDRHRGRARRARGEPAQDVQAGRPRDPRGAGHRPGAAAGRDARARGGVGQRQDHARAPPARPDRAGRGLDGRARRPPRRREDREARRRRRPGAADRLPEPGRRAQPALLDPPHHRAGDHEAARQAGARARGPPRSSWPTPCASTPG